MSIKEVLSAPFLNSKTDESRSFEFVVLFRDHEQMDILSDTGYDMILEMFNDAVAKKHGEGWFIDDTVENVREANGHEEVDIDLSEYKEML